ncbi:DHA2 family efflux MFS transporter permease subunit [Persicobacter psychrovividus]|uniref:Multidrug resistance protein n=1 Tax=Persicobacter psychrovividus TaxID=387638 RepID=A0ABM7VCW6_9BACT|nr:multidrug resistance protein [Persicobacter psychrovividus]
MAAKGFVKWIIVATTVIAAVLELIDTTIVNVALTNISGNLGATIEDTSWVVTGYAIANVIIIPLTGFLANYFGRKNYYFYSILLFTISSYFCGASNSLEMLVFFRILQGIGGGALLSTSQSILFDAFELEERPIASAIFSMGLIVGPTIGPTLGGFIVDNYHWSLIFDINIPLGILAAAMVFLYIDKKPEEYHIDRSKIHIDRLGIIFLALWVGSLQYILERGQSEDWFNSKLILGLAILCVLTLGLFIWQELRTDKPAVDIRILKDPNLAMTTFIALILGFGLYSSMYVYPVWMQRLLGYTATETGMSLIPGALFSAFCMPIVGKLMQKGAYPKYLLFVGFGVYAIFSFWMSLASPMAGMVFFVMPLLIRGIGLGFSIVPITNQAIAGLKPEEIPQGVAINNMIRQLGGAFGIALMNTYIVRKVAGVRGHLISFITPDNPAFVEKKNLIMHGLIAKGVNVHQASATAMRMIEGLVDKQAYTITYVSSFQVIGVFFVCILPICLIMKKTKVNGKVEAGH